MSRDDGVALGLVLGLIAFAIAVIRYLPVVLGYR